MDIYYWESFCKYGDISFLKNISIDGQTIIKKYIHQLVKYKGLQRILLLYYNKVNIPFVNKLTDIISLSYHTKGMKKIYIFGENHYPINNCSNDQKGMKVLDFIKINIENIPKFMDFFTETTYLSKGDIYKRNKDETLTLYKFEERYYNCLYPNKDLCDFPNVRFHNTDIRRPFEKNRPFILHFFDLIYHIQKEYDNKDKLEYYLESYKNYINQSKNDESFKEYKNINDLKGLIKLVEKIYPIKKIAKQLKNSQIKETLTKYSQNELLKLNYRFMNFNFINKFMTDKRLLDNIVITNLRFESIFMDVYLMARVFRSFDQIEYKNSRDPQNIIIYVGDAHAENYRKILDQLKFKREFNTRAKEHEFCINISKLKQPLFSG